ncbi:MAG TPA: DUF6804 family protein [Terriglobales bacterium]
MLTKVIKWSAIAALIGGAFLRSAPDYALPLSFVVVAAAVIVLTQAAIMHRYVWMTLFLVVVGLFNPVVPLPFSNYVFGIASCYALLLFFFSLELLRPKPRLSVASITNRMPGSQSL